MWPYEWQSSQSIFHWVARYYFLGLLLIWLRYCLWNKRILDTWIGILDIFKSVDYLWYCVLRSPSINRHWIINVFPGFRFIMFPGTVQCTTKNINILDFGREFEAWDIAGARWTSTLTAANAEDKMGKNNWPDPVKWRSEDVLDIVSYTYTYSMKTKDDALRSYWHDIF